MLTLNEVQNTLPANHRANISQAMVDQLNALSKDPEEARHIRDSFVSYSKVLSEGRFKLSDYVRAVMYVSHKVMNKSNLDAYKATFPERYAAMVAANKPSKDIASIVSAYNKNLLVSKIMEQAIIPTWILNQSMFQDALNTQYELMTDVDVSDKVRCEAANSLLTHLKKPEQHKTELKIDVALNDGMAALEKSLTDMSHMQIDAIENNPKVSAKTIAHMPMMKTVN